MKCNTIAALRAELEQLETRKLDALLLEELRREVPDGELVRLIGSILRQRQEEALPRISPGIQQAWEDYRQKTQTPPPSPRSGNARLVKAASLILVLLALAALIPREASAKSFFQRFVDWTEDVFSLVSPREVPAPKTQYRFHTDNPGLQEVYDQVTALGITAPVVPMWLPEGYTLVECRSNTNPYKQYLIATFSNGISHILFQLDCYTDNKTCDFYKNTSSTQTIEKDGIIYTILNNNNLWVIVWTLDNLECSLALDCLEDEVYQILESIHTMGDE